jgi:hypothetical protein
MTKRSWGIAVAAVLFFSALWTPTASASATASMNVVHGIPGVDVEVCVNGSIAIDDFNPGEVVTGVDLPAGDYNVKLVAAGDVCGDPAILAANGLRLRGGRNYTAIAYLKADGTPTLGLFANNARPLARAGVARLTVRHTAAAPRVDVWANGSVLLRDVRNGESATMRVPTGVYAMWASLPNRLRPVIGPSVLRLERGTAYQVYAWGNATAGYRFAVVAVHVGVD